jgi:hypothetical protein
MMTFRLGLPRTQALAKNFMVAKKDERAPYVDPISHFPSHARIYSR